MTIQGLIDEILPRLLRPVARFCVRHSITVRPIIYALKQAMISAAREELESRGEKATISRISLLTGMHRVELPELIAKKGAPPADQPNLLSKIVSVWESSPQYVTAKGDSRVLSTEGKDSEFHRLSWTLSKSIHPTTAVKELQRLGVVSMTKRGARLVKSAVIPLEDTGRIYRLLADDIADLYRVVHKNLDPSKPPPELHIRTEYDNIYAACVPEIRSWLALEGARFHARVRKFLGARDKDSGAPRDGAAGRRVVVTTFGDSDAET